MRVLILRGISGSGKTTYASKVRNALVVSADDYFTYEGVYRFDPRKLPAAHAQCLKRYMHIVLHYPIDDDLVLVVDNTNTKLLEVAPYIAIAQAHGIDIEVRIFPMGPEQAIKQGVHGVPYDVLTRQWRNLENSYKEWPVYWPRAI